MASNELAGVVVGLASGLVLGRGLGDDKPPVRRVAAALCLMTAVAAAWAAPLHGITDVRPEIEQIVAIENRTASAYEAAAGQFRKRRIALEALTQIIDRTIIPELQAADAHLKTLDNVPQEQHS